MINNLKNYPSGTIFPLDFIRPNILSGSVGREAFFIDSNLSAKLNNISEDQDITTQNLLLIAFGILLNLFSEDTDIYLGTRTINNIKSDSEPKLNQHADTNILRLKIKKEYTFSENVIANSKEISSSSEVKNKNLEDMVDINNSEQLLNINPLFQIMFTWQDNPRQPVKESVVNDDRTITEDSVFPLDLTINVWEANNRLEGDFEFNTDILSRESIIQLKNNFIHLLKEITSKQNIPISSYDYCSEYTLSYLAKLNNTQSEIPDVLLHDLFSICVSDFSNKTALIFEGKKISYQELDNLSNKLANRLFKEGIQEGDIVGLNMNPSIEQIVAIFGILKAGACYLPLDPSFPKNRLQYIHKDSGAQYIITNENSEKFYEPSSSLHIINFNSLKDIESQPINLVQNIKHNQDSIAYIIYTSGSTGNPKGVIIHHRAVVNFILSMAKTPGISSNDNLLSVTTLSFDISVLEVFLPLSIGATLILANEKERANNEINSLIVNYDITFLQATPATWNILLSSNWEGSPKLKALCGGEAMPPSLAKKLIPKVKELWNMYGPTETTVWSTCKKITDAIPPIRVGYPIANTQIFILDSEFRKLPLNVEGEIAIGGEGLSKGYYKREELTKEKFILKDGQVLYLTGDIGKIRTNGDIEILGRKDNQTKIRGFRIELEEIESNLCLIEGIKQAVVKVHKFDENDQRLVAFILFEDLEIKPAIEFINNILRKKLPEYMIPAHYMYLNSFPRTPNGKVDRNALKFNIESLEKIDGTTEGNLNDIEQKVYEFFATTLRHRNFNRNSNFFEIGGNSLLSLKVILLIEKEFEVTIKLRDFFEYYNCVWLIGKLITQSLNNKGNLNNKLIDSKKRLNYLYCLNSKGDSTPVFGIYSEKLFMDLDELEYGPIYDFIWPGAEGKLFEMNSVEEIAKTYSKELMKVLPNGPYYLLGFSFGGVIAFEIALQLQKIGLKVPILLLLDTMNPQLSVNPFHKYKQKIKNLGFIKFLIPKLFKSVPRYLRSILQNIMITVYKKFNKRLSANLTQRMILNETNKIATKYHPGFYNGKIHLFKTDENYSNDIFLGWRPHAVEIREYVLEGHHLDLLYKKENKLIITKELEKLINEV